VGGGERSAEDDGLLREWNSIESSCLFTNAHDFAIAFNLHTVYPNSRKAALESQIISPACKIGAEFAPYQMVPSFPKQQNAQFNSIRTALLMILLKMAPPKRKVNENGNA
jgi:hypothetical protein